MGSMDIVHGAHTSPADPLLTAEKRARGDLSMGRAVIDACRPFHWRDQFPKVNAPAPDQARRAREVRPPADAGRKLTAESICVRFTAPLKGPP